MIAWYDNIPVVSYALLKGRCRHCGRHISIRYPAVEAITGLLFFFFVWTLGPTAVAGKMCVFSAIMVALIFSDLEKRLLPDELTLGGMLVGFAFSIFVRVPDITNIENAKPTSMPPSVNSSGSRRFSRSLKIRATRMALKTHILPATAVGPRVHTKKKNNSPV